MKNKWLSRILVSLLLISIVVNIILTIQLINSKNALYNYQKEVSLSIVNMENEVIKNVENYKTYSVTLKDLLVELKENDIISVSIVNSTYGNYITEMMGIAQDSTSGWVFASSTHVLCAGNDSFGTNDSCSVGIDSIYISDKDSYIFYNVSYASY